MPTHRSEHNIEDIKREINAIIRHLKDPRLESGFVNILNISTSEDGSSCRVFVSSLEGINKTQEAVEVLNGAKGYIRGKLGENLRLRYVPNLNFIATDAIEYGINMSKKIDELVTE